MADIKTRITTIAPGYRNEKKRLFQEGKSAGKKSTKLADWVDETLEVFVTDLVEAEYYGYEQMKKLIDKHGDRSVTITDDEILAVAKVMTQDAFRFRKGLQEYLKESAPDTTITSQMLDDAIFDGEARGAVEEKYPEMYPPKVLELRDKAKISARKWRYVP